MPAETRLVRETVTWLKGPYTFKVESASADHVIIERFSAGATGVYLRCKDSAGTSVIILSSSADGISTVQAVFFGDITGTKGYFDTSQTGISWKLVEQVATDICLVVAGAASQSGVLYQLRGQSSTSERQQADIDTAWADSTDATRKARYIIRVWDTAARELFRGESDGSGANFSFFAAGSWGGGRNVVFLPNAAVVPSTNPTGGGILYSEGGSVKWRDSSGNVTTMGGGGAGGAPSAADYWIETAHADLSAEVVVGTTGITTAAYASRQAAAKAGRLFLPNNGFVLERDTGSAWAPWGPIFPLTAPVDGDFAWINQGSATVSTTNGGIYLYSTSNGGAHNFRIRTKAAPATPYTLTVLMLANLHLSDFSQIGVLWRQSSDGKLVVMTLKNDGATASISLDKWDAPGTFNAAYIAATAYPWLSRMFIQLRDDGTNRKVRFAVDGQNPIEIHTVGRTDYLTADEIGFAVNPYSQETGVTLVHWLQGA